jgi:hypothetical protein
VRSFGAEVLYKLIVIFAPSLSSMITAGAITYGVFQELRGEPAGFGDCLRVGIGALLRVTGVAGAVWLLVMLLLAVDVFVSGLAIRAAGVSGVLPTLVLFVFFAIPALAVMCRLWVAVPCAIVERTGVFGSLRRSGFLTRGAGMPILALILLLGAIGIGAGIGVRIAVPRSDVDWTRSPEPQTQVEWQAYAADIRAATIDSERTQHVCALLVGAILAGLNAVAGVIVYHDLRVQKEHVDVERIAAVFD